MAHPMQIITPDNAFSDLTAGTTVVVSDDAVILTREQAQVVLDVLGLTTDGPAAHVYDAIVEQVGP